MDTTATVASEFGIGPSLDPVDRPSGVLRACKCMNTLVGPPGFEPGTSCTPSKRASQAAPRPDLREETISLPRLCAECRSFGENHFDIAEKTQTAERPAAQLRTGGEPIPPKPRIPVAPVNEKATRFRDFTLEQPLHVGPRLR